MIFYRLALQRIISYFHLDELFKENEFRLMLLHKKPKIIYKSKLRTNKSMNLCMSTLLSVISLLVCLAIPYATLEFPCEELKKRKLDTLYVIAKWIEHYLALIDRTIISLSIMLALIWVKTMWDGIRETNINISPWLESGKYVLPEKVKRLRKY